MARSLEEEKTAQLFAFLHKSDILEKLSLLAFIMDEPM